MVHDAYSRMSRMAEHIVARPALFFLVAASLFGLLIVFRMQPLTGTDEFTHFPRAYQISEGQLWQERLDEGTYGGWLPTNIKVMTDDYRDLSRKDDAEYHARADELGRTYGSTDGVGIGREEAAFSSDVVYPPWSFTPASLGILTARLLGLPLIWYIYLARIFTLAVWILLAWLAIRLVPDGKWFITMVALLPTSLTQAATIGLDGLVNGLSWLFIAMVLAVFAGTLRMRGWRLAALTLAGFSVCVIKQGYILVAAFALIIPARHFASSQAARIWKALSGILYVGAAAAFALYSSKVSGRINLTQRSDVYINANAQAEYILLHPFEYIFRILIQPFTKSYDTVYLGLVGILTNRLIYLSILLIILLYLGMFVAATQAGYSIRISGYRRRLLFSTAAIIGGTSVIISTAAYLTFNQVGSPVVEGIYGRYYLPLLPLLLVVPLAVQHRKVLSRATFALVMCSVIVFSLASTVASMY